MSLQRVQPIIPTWRKEPFDDPGTMAFDPTRNIDRFYVVQVLPTLYTRATTTQCRIARRSHVTELPSRQLVGC